MNIVRTAVALIAGMLLITVIAEATEFLLVAAVHGGVTTDQAIYFTIRNQPTFLVLKLAYNAAAALAGGYACARVAGRKHVVHGTALAVLQTAALVWAITQPELARTGPMWMWVTLIVTMPPVIVLGAWHRARKTTQTA